MAQTVKITPATGLLEFIGDNVANKPILQHDNAGNLTLTLQATKKFTIGGNLKVNGKVTMVQQTLTDNAAITWDFNNGANAKVTLGGNRTLVISNIETGDTGLLLVTQDGTGGRTLTLPNGSAIVGGGSYIPTATAGATDVIGVYYDGTTYWWTIGYNTVTPPLTSVGISGADFVISNSPLTSNGTIGLALAAVNSNVGTFGSASAVPVITVNAKGLITAVSTTGISIPTDLNSLTDVTLTSPAANQLLQYNGSQWVNWTPNYVPNTRTLTINGTSYDLTADRAWTISTVSYTSKLQHQVKAGVAINKGQAVYVTSGDGTNMIVGLASNASESTSSKTMGLLDATVAINGFANVVTEGLLAGLDTSAAGSEGDPVWLGTGGNLIYGLANKPYAPAHLVFIGIVTRKQQINGEIFVKVQNGFELNEIHDVDLKTSVPVNGQILGYNGTLWVNKTIAQWLGFTPANDANVVHRTGDETVAGVKTFTNNLFVSPSTNPAQIQLAGTNPEMYVHATSGTSRFFINRATTGNQATLMFTTGMNVVQNSAWDYSGSPLWSLGMTNNNNADSFKLAYGDIYDAGSVALEITSGQVAYFRNVPYAGGNLLATQAWVQAGYVPTGRTITINGTSYDLSANRSWTISSVSTSTQTYRGIIEDTRAAERTPNDYDDYRVSWEFTNQIPGLNYGGSSWWSLMTMQGWHDNYSAWQIIGSASSILDDFYLRSGNVTTWNPARRIWHSGDFTSTNVSNWNTAYGWGNHASAGYLTSATAATTYVSLSGSYANPSWITSLAYSKITGVPAFLTSYTETDTLATVTGRGATTSTAVTFNGNVKLGNNADLIFEDLAGTFPTSGKGFDWTLNNDGARIYAIQPSSDSIDFVFQLRDNATTNDRFVFHVQEWQGAAFDKYPLIIRGGTEFDLVDSGLFVRGTQVLTNNRVLQNISGNISMFTNDSGYITTAALSGYATQVYVNTQISNLVNGAPALLDTLDELAAALGDDSNFATTITNSISGKVAKAGDTMTGELIFSMSAPQIRFTDTDHYDHWIHVNSNRFYILSDRNGDGAWETPYPMELNSENNTGYIFGNVAIHAGNIGSYALTSYSETDTLATVTARGSSTTGSIYVNGLLTGGLGAATTGGTLDWNDSSNARAGQGYTLLLGSHTNGPGPGEYFHPVGFEYSTKDGSGNVTQLAISYGSPGNKMYMRGRYGGSWTGWTQFITSANISSQNVNYASSAGYAENLFGLGYIQSTSAGTSYTQNYQVRENSGGGSSTNEIYAPQLAFHWSGVVASSIMLESSGRIAIRNNPGNDYEDFIARIIYSSGNGDSTQWNTAYGWGNHASAGYAQDSTVVKLAGDQTITGQKTFPSSIASRPILGGGFLSALSSDGNYDMWGISEDYYPSHATAANAWGIQWNGDNNEVRFIGGGSQRLVIDLDGASNGLTWNGNTVWHAGNDGASSGLDADLLDGYHASGSVGANTVVIRDVNGYIYGNYINTNVGVDNPSISNFITDNGDGWMRKSSIAHVRNSLGNYGGWLTQAAADPLYVNVTGDSMTGPLIITGTTSGQELFAVNGVNGRLFTVTDDLSNSLFSVNTIAGLPVIEAFANNTVKLGPFASPVTIDSTGNLTLKAVGSANNIKIHTEDDNSWVSQTKPDGTEVGRMGFDGFSTPSAYYTEYTVSTRSSADAGLVRRIYITDSRVLALQNLTGFTYNGANVATQTWVQSQGYLTSVSDVWVNTSGDTMTGNLYVSPTSNPAQIQLAGTNPELYVHATSGTARLFINRQSTGNQSTLHFATGMTVTQGGAWNFSGSPMWTLGMTNNNNADSFKIAYGDIYDAPSVALEITSGQVAYFRNVPYAGGNLLATQSWVQSQGYLTSVTAHTHSISDITDAARWWNNMGQNHSTQTDFNSISEFGFRFVQGSTNGPGTGSSQFYGMSLGLGNDYAFSNYAMQFAIPRYNSSDRYISFRTREAGTWGSWYKIYAGYSDTTGSISGYNNPTTSATANTIVYRDSSGHIYGNYILGAYANFSSGNSENPTIGQIWTQNTSDNYLRKSTPAHFRSQIIDGYYIKLDTDTTTSGKLTLTYNTAAEPLSALEIRGGGTHTGIYINPQPNAQAHIRFGSENTLRWQIRAPFQDGIDTSLKIYSWVTNDDVFVFDHDGTLTVDNRLIELSSIRYKTQVESLTPALDKVMHLRPITYVKIGGAGNKEIGLIAEEVAEIYPELIKYNEEGQVDGINYTRIAPILIKTIQEQQDLIKKLTKRIDDLENR